MDNQLTEEQLNTAAESIISEYKKERSKETLQAIGKLVLILILALAGCVGIGLYYGFKLAFFVYLLLCAQNLVFLQTTNKLKSRIDHL